MVNQDLDPRQKGTPHDITNPAQTEGATSLPIYDLGSNASLIATHAAEFLGMPVINEQLEAYLTNLSKLQHPFFQGIELAGYESSDEPRYVKLTVLYDKSLQNEGRDVEDKIDELHISLSESLESNAVPISIPLMYRSLEGKNLEDIGDPDEAVDEEGNKKRHYWTITAPTDENRAFIYRARIYNPSQGLEAGGNESGEALSSEVTSSSGNLQDEVISPPDDSGKILQFPTKSSIQPQERDGETLASNFDRQVRESGAFSHIGFMMGQDYLGRYVTDIYLLQPKPDAKLPKETQRKIVDVIDSFNEFALFYDTSMGVRIHFIDGRGVSGEDLDAELKRIESNSKLQFVYSEALPTP